MNVKELKDAIRERYSFPGCYSKVLIMPDGGYLCLDCAESHFKYIADSIKRNLSDGWKAEAVDIYREGPVRQCCHCNRDIESRYGDPEADNA